MTKRLLAILFLCHVCSPFAGSADEVSVIQPIDGAAYDGELSSAEDSQSIRIDLSPGDFVRGSVRGEEITVWLLGRDQSKLRRLASSIGTVQSFMFVASDRGPYSFKVSGQRGTGYKLQLDSVLALADQTPIAEEVASPKLRELRKRLDAGEDISKCWSEIVSQGTPLIETTNVKPSLPEDEVLVTFLWRGAKRNVRIFGAPSGDHDELKQLRDSNIWYHSYRVPDTARINYRLAPDVPDFPGTSTQRRRAILATAQRDPLNPLHEPDEPIDDYEGFSIVELPDAPKAVWSTVYPSHPKGTVETHRLTSKILGNTRDIHVYRSAGYEANDPERAFVVTFDGDQYRDEVRVPIIMDNLVAAGKIPPTAAIMISNPSQKSRSTELPCNNDFARFIGEELMPWAKTQNVTASRERTVVAGASFGGLCSVFIGLKHPELFGNVFSQSGSLWWAPGGFETKGESESQWLTRQYVSAPSQPVRYYLQAGTFEEPSGILQCTKHLRDVLQAKGYDVTYGEFVGGHGYFYWRHSFADGIMHLLQ